MLVAALTAAVAALLTVAGAAKLRTPGPAAVMLAGLGIGSRTRARAVVRSAAVVEIAVGAATLVIGGRAAAAALAACYLVLTAAAIRLAVAPEPAPCGCFGAADGDVGLAHILVDVAALGIAISAVVAAPSGLGAWFGSEPGLALTAAAQAALLAALGYLSITALPALAAARRRLEKT